MLPSGEGSYSFWMCSIRSLKKLTVLLTPFFIIPHFKFAFPYHSGEIIRHAQRCMTKAEWKKATQYGGGGVRLSADKTHRFRTTSAHRCPGYKAPAGLDSTARTNAAHQSVAVFLTDSKAHARPEVAS